VQGFYKKTREERVQLIAEQMGLQPEEISLLNGAQTSFLETADKMIENALGFFPMPLGIATYFRINGVDRFVPMVVEEPSVVAAASYAAKLARPTGFIASGSSPLMIAQIQLVGKQDWTQAQRVLESNKEQILSLANAVSPSIVQKGGGAKDLEIRLLPTLRGDMLIVHLIVDVRDSMGANIVTKMAEGIAPLLESLTEATVRLRILSNLSTHRMFRAEAVWKRSQLEESIKGTGKTVDDVIEAILDAWAFAEADPFRAATHNKGIMNGIDAVVIATGNDFRAVESGAHSFASYKTGGRYSSLTKYERTPEGDLKGTIELPLALGTVGGAIRSNPLSRLCYKILGMSNEATSTTSETTAATMTSQQLSTEILGEIVASVGLAQNFAALRALSTEGILRGHLKLHAKNVAMMGGAQGPMVDFIAAVMASEGNVSTTRAKELLSQLCCVM